MSNKLRWMDKAACKGTNDDRVFDSHPTEQQAFSREYCTECPVISECLLDAIENKMEFGIWGGMSASDREKLVKRFKYTMGALSVNKTLS